MNPRTRKLIATAFALLIGAVLLSIVVLVSAAGGDLDTTFDPVFTADDNVQTVAVQSDGKVVIGGLFTSYNGTSRNYIARINADGSLDTSFNRGTGTNGWVYTTALQSDGSINFTETCGEGIVVCLASVSANSG